MDKTFHTTNYFNTLIEVAEDTPVTCSTKPLPKGEQKSIALLQYELLAEQPYQYTSDELFFKVFAIRNQLDEQVLEKAREVFFSKGQPCFRSSPLTKKYGFGIHANQEGKVALVGMETEQYSLLHQDVTLKKVKAMRSSKK